jgi:hypothetical protein
VAGGRGGFHFAPGFLGTYGRLQGAFEAIEEGFVAVGSVCARVLVNAFDGIGNKLDAQPRGPIVDHSGRRELVRQ